MRRMKSLLAFALALVLFTTSSFADSLKLPGELKTIGEDAFSGTTSVEQIHIPWGTETIHARAFAGSSATEVYIPGTVTFIGEDAFANTPVTIYGAPGSVAQEYAEANGIPFADCGNYFWQERMDAYDALEEVTLDDLTIEDETPLSTEGITDPEMLAFINAYNSFNAEHFQNMQTYIAAADELSDNLGSLDEIVSNFSYQETDSAVTYSLGFSSLILDKDVMGEVNEEIVSAQANEVNGCTTMVTNSGAVYFMYNSGGNIHISKTPGGSLMTSRAARNQFEQFVARLDAIENTIGVIKSGIAGAEKNCNNIIDSNKKSIEMLDEYKASRMPDVSDNVLNRIEELKAKHAKNIADVEKGLNALKVVNGVLAIVNIPGIILHYRGVVTHWGKILDIADHNHPNSLDMKYPRGIDLSNQLNRDIQRLNILYVTEALVAAVQLYDAVIMIGTAISAISTGVATPPAIAAWGAVLAEAGVSLVALGATMTLSAIASNTYNTILDTDDILHSFVSGTVRDSETGKAIEGVGVIAAVVNPDDATIGNSVSCITDQNGHYILPLPNDRMVMRFRKAKYEDFNCEVIAIRGKTVPKDVEMDPKNGTLFGIVYEEGDRLPIEDALVVCGELQTYTDANGNFSLSVPEGNAMVKASKDGYIDSEDVPVTIEKDQVKIVELPMRKQNIILTREDLENVANNPNGDYILGANIYLGDEEWTPLPWFSGTFDGNRHSISGMYISSGESVGLFQGLYGGYVHDLFIVSADIDLPANAQYTNVGLLGGSLNNNATVENVMVSGDIRVTPGSGSVFAGGFSGYIGQADMSDCGSVVRIDVSGSNTINVGGIAAGMSKGQLVNCDANVEINVVQSASNSSANFYVYGNTYCGNGFVEECDVRGSLFVQTINGNATACGLARGTDGSNHASVSVLTESGTVNAIGCMEGERIDNDGVIIATSTGNGQANATGIDRVNNGTNSVPITAFSQNGSANAAGGQSCGIASSNTGGVRAETGFGTANAIGLSGKNSAADCSNTGAVTAIAKNGNTYAVGITGCSFSRNTGSIQSKIETGNIAVQGISQSTGCVNTGVVSAEYNGSSSGSLSAQGLNSCTDSTNYGSVTGEVKKSTTACTVTGAANGSGNANYGRVEARSSTGPSNARGVYCNNSQNYGTIFAQSTCNTVSEISNATAYGIGPGYSGCLNEGAVTAISKSSVAYAYGFSGGSNNTSTGLVSATSQYFVIRQIENGYEGELGRAYASNSAYVTATVADCTVSAAGNETENMYFFIARSSCGDHRGMARQFVTYNAATEPELDGCYVPCGYAMAVN